MVRHHGSHTQIHFEFFDEFHTDIHEKSKTVFPFSYKVLKFHEPWVTYQFAHAYVAHRCKTKC